MKTNREWLNELAANDVDALQAWFDAEHQSTTPKLSQLFGSLSDDGGGQVDATDVDSGADSREQLERDIDVWLDSWTGASVPVSEIKQAVGQWLDRQAAITNAAWKLLKESWVTAHDSLLIENGELREQVDNLSDERDRLNRRNSELRTQYDNLRMQVDNLSHDLAESERFREELREELSVAYDHAHDLLARRDKGLA